MNQPINQQFVCEQCEKICKSKTGLASHLRAHLRKTEQVNNFVCEQCEKICKSKTGLASHLRAHQRDKPAIQ